VNAPEIVVWLVITWACSFVWGFVIGFIRKLRTHPTDAGQDNR